MVALGRYLNTLKNSIRGGRSHIKKEGLGSVPGVVEDMRFAEDMLVIIRALTCYRMDKHPIHLWKVYRICHLSGLRIPPEVEIYLLQISEGLDLDSEDFPKKCRPDRFINKVITKGNHKDFRHTWKKSALIIEAFAMNENLKLSKEQKKTLRKKFHLDKRAIYLWLKAGRGVG